MSRPQLIVFDLDFTLWPFFVDVHLKAPFRLESNGKVYDRADREIKYYQDVPTILENLHKDGYKLAIASMTSSPEGAQSLLDLFGWNQYFQYKEMYPGCKVTHFQRIHDNSKVPYNQMIFFDDQPWNIFYINKLDVLCVLVEEEGVTKKLIADSLKSFNR